MLASDLGNREFVNPRNPDDLLHVEFFWKEPVDKWESETQGKEVRLPKQPWVRIMNPADKTSIYENAVRDDHKARWPQKWLKFQIDNGQAEGAAGEAFGWKLEEWKGLKENELLELRHLRFETVDQLAGASDGQLQRLGMGGIGLRERARAALRDRNASEFKAALDAKDAEITEMKERMARMEAFMASQPAPRPEPMSQKAK